MRARVLLADDDPILREFAGEYLRESGFSVTLAEDGRQALGMARADRFDLIVTDICMPNMDGIELLQALRGAHPRMPVLAISAGVGGAHADLLLETAKALGAVAVLQKPLARASFLAAVKESLAAGSI